MHNIVADEFSGCCDKKGLMLKGIMKKEKLKQNK